MNERKQHITLTLDTHRLAFDIDPEKEPNYRQAAQQLNHYFQSYRRQMPKATTDLLWAYVALQMAVNLYNDAREKQLQPIEDKLHELNQLILNNIQQTL
ncbi:MAG: cell division protein ZapA [Paludibacteraceae bacterium]|nr:cell division protein ZapA [Paludibacteraceae bacterium]